MTTGASGGGRGGTLNLEGGEGGGSVKKRGFSCLKSGALTNGTFADFSDEKEGIGGETEQALWNERQMGEWHDKRQTPGSEKNKQNRAFHEPMPAGKPFYRLA